MTRLENLIGAQSLALADRLTDPGVPHSEAAALVTLLAHPGRTTGWLGEVLGITSGGVTRLVDRLVAADLVSRSQGSDARRRTLALTSKGRARAEELLRRRRAALGSALSVLDPEEQLVLERLLGKVVGAMTDDRLAALQLCRLCDRTACAQGSACPLDHTVGHD